jgi:hypothetical protein
MGKFYIGLVNWMYYTHHIFGDWLVRKVVIFPNAPIFIHQSSFFKMIPEQYKQFCSSEEINYCKYFMDKSCPQTCAYATDILGVGAMSEQDYNQIKTKHRIEEFLHEEPIKDYKGNKFKDMEEK